METPVYSPLERIGPEAAVNVICNKRLPIKTPNASGVLRYDTKVDTARVDIHKTPDSKTSLGNPNFQATA